MSFLDNCRRLVGLESTPSHGNLSVAEFVGDLCQQAGLHVEYHRESQKGIDQCNVIARPQSGVPREEFLLQTHLDTAEPGHFSHWTQTQSNPFNASIYGNLLYGLGAADVKLDFLCKLEAVREFAHKPLKVPFVLVGTFGARSAMSGAIKLIRRKKLTAKRAIIGEPTQMGLVIAGKGLATVEISIPFSQEEWSYRREHDIAESSSSQSRMFSANEGENAVVKMLDYLAQLPEGIALMDLDGGINSDSNAATAVLELDTVAGFADPIVPKIAKICGSLRALEAELRDFREEGFVPPYPTINMGMIRTSENGVRISGSCRVPPSVTDAVYQGWMKNLEYAVQDAGATFRVNDYRNGFSADPSSEFVQTAQGILVKMGLRPDLSKITVATEASVLSRLGIECLVWGPGESVGNSQAPNEHIQISDLKTAIEFYKRLVERFCV